MRNINELIQSGLLESYLMGMASPHEIEQVEQMAEAHEEIREELNAIEQVLEEYALQNAIEPDPIIKPFLMATIDYKDRLAIGEIPESPPVLHENSKIADYDQWINRSDMVAPVDLTDIYAKIISYTSDMICALVWIKEMAPQETHDNEFERFLILEGSCIITIENAEHSLHAGCYLEIPLHKNHFVRITSDIPCKVILQRVAA
ncbi:cupin domain-containing protein [Daejeonella oryzae]|uniref:cupin domain-containing protein n=1 Tax=Daejeonella oryzae TaxID=1122943 RepID=UPI00041F2C41|nr:cupin domain-containing protein [Daejeonella oryzae]